jgi:hypothetical protein
MVAAAAALTVLAGGGGAVWFAIAEDDDPAQGATAPGITLGESLDETEAPDEPPAEDATTEQTEPETEESEPTPEATKPTPRSPEATEFPREPRNRERQQNDRVRREFAVPPARKFSGTGNAQLGDIDSRQPAVVRWSTKGRFELRFGRESFPIIAPSATGELVVPPYSFERVRVIAAGKWTISITPQG